MLTKKQVEEIKEHLERAQNPIFFFDNDCDGLCSFLLLQRFISRGRGVAAKTFPNLDVGLYKRVVELNADYIFILDKPNVSQDFFLEAKNNNIPVVWIDHHETNTQIPEDIFYYNSFYSGNKKGQPTTSLCYQITNRKEDLWIAVIGCIADSFMPKFYLDFLKEFPEIGIKTKEPFEVLYNSTLGKIARMLDSGLMDTTTNVVNMLKFLMKAKSPYEILEENKKTEEMHMKFEFLEKKRKKLVDKARDEIDENKNYLYFEYSGDTSMSADLSNELYYLFPKKYIVVVYIKGAKANISVRGKNVKDKIISSVSSLSGATGGGHTNAAGAQVSVDDLLKFKDNFLKELN